MQPLSQSPVTLKPNLIITAVFLLYGLLLTPFGHVGQPVERDANPGYYSIRNIDPGDDSGYYAYVRSAVIDGDLDFFDERGFWHFDAITPTGYTANYWYIGAPILWSPFFLTGHAMAAVSQAAGAAVPLNGYSLPYRGMTFIGSALLTLGGLLLCHACLKRRFAPKVALGVTLLVFTATCLPYFTFIRNRMSHSGDVFAAFLFFYCFLLFREKRDQPRWFFLGWGLLLGLLADLRYISIVYAFLPLGQAGLYLLKSPREKRRPLWTGLALGVLGCVIAFLPQAVFWLRVHGVFSSLNPFTVLVEPSLTGVLESMAQMFTGGTRGLVYMEFIWVAGLLGLPLVWRRDPLLASMLTLVFLGFASAQIVIMDPATFGQRYLLPALPVLAWGLAELAETLNRHKQWRLVFTLGIAGSLWIYILILNYKVVLQHNDPEFLYHALKQLPDLADRAGLVRPTTLIDLWAQGEIRLQTAQQWMFLVILPGTFFVLTAALTVLAVRPPSTTMLKFSGRAGTAFGVVFSLALSLWIFAAHPPKESPEIAERYRISAVSQWLKNPPQMKAPEKLLEKSEALAPESDDTWRIRGDLVFMQGDWKRAQSLYRKAIERDAKSAAWVQLERARLIERQNPEAEIEDSAALQHLKRGFKRLDFENKPLEAMEEFKKALGADPQSKYAAGLQAILIQFAREKLRMEGQGSSITGLPTVFWQILGTRLNEIRARLPLF